MPPTLQLSTHTLDHISPPYNRSEHTSNLLPEQRRFRWETEHKLEGRGTLEQKSWVTSSLRGLPTPPRDMNGVKFAHQVSVPAAGCQKYYNTSKPCAGTREQNMAAGAKNPYGHFSSNGKIDRGTGKPTLQGTQAEPHSRSGSDVVSYLQIPSSVNNSKASLSEFAAQVTSIVRLSVSRADCR